MLVLFVQRSHKVLFNELFFSNIPSSIVYFEYGTFHQFSMGLELLGGGHDC